MLVNLIHKRLKGKTVQELSDYQLSNKMLRINPRLIEIFALQKIQEFTSDNDITAFVKEEYVTYDDVQFEELYKLYDDKYPEIYELIDLFQ